MQTMNFIKYSVFVTIKTASSISDSIFSGQKNSVRICENEFVDLDSMKYFQKNLKECLL